MKQTVHFDKIHVVLNYANSAGQDFLIDAIIINTGLNSLAK